MVPNQGLPYGQRPIAVAVAEMAGPQIPTGWYVLVQVGYTFTDRRGTPTAIQDTW